MKHNFSNKLKALAVFPLLFLLWYFMHSALNVPFIDDFNTLQAVLDMKVANGFGAFWHVLTAQHNEHRIITTRLVFWVLSWLGPIDLRVPMLLSLLAWLYIVRVFYKKAGRGKHAGYLVLGATLLLCNPAFHTSLFWGMASVQNLGVVVLVALALRFQEKSKVHQVNLYPMLVMALLAGITSGNGMFVFVVLVVVFLYNRNVKFAGITAAVGVAFSLVYFIGFVNPPNNPDSGLSGFVAHPISRITYFLQFYGGGLAGLDFPISHALHLPYVAGIAIAALATTLLFMPGVIAKNGFLVGLLWFVGLTGVAVALNRAGATGGLADVATSSRFQQYGLLALAASFMLLLKMADGQDEDGKGINQDIFYGQRTTHYIAIGALSVSILVWGFNYLQHTPNVRYHRRELMLSLVNWYNMGDGLDHNNIYADAAQTTLVAAIKANVYQTPIWAKQLQSQMTLAKVTTGLSSYMEITEAGVNDYWIRIQNPDNLPLATNADNGFIALSQHGSVKYLLPCYPIRRGGFKGFRNLKSLLDFEDVGLISRLRYSYIRYRPGIYNLGLVVRQPGGKLIVENTNQTIEVPSTEAQQVGVMQ